MECYIPPFDVYCHLPSSLDKKVFEDRKRYLYLSPAKRKVCQAIDLWTEEKLPEKRGLDERQVQEREREESPTVHGPRSHTAVGSFPTVPPKIQNPQ